jgi:hypothetical protein
MMQRHDSKAMLKKMEMDYDARMEEQVDDLREKMRLLRKIIWHIFEYNHIQQRLIERVTLSNSSQTKIQIRSSFDN